MLHLFSQSDNITANISRNHLSTVWHAVRRTSSCWSGNSSSIYTKCALNYTVMIQHVNQTASEYFSHASAWLYVCLAPQKYLNYRMDFYDILHTKSWPAEDGSSQYLHNDSVDCYEIC